MKVDYRIYDGGDAVPPSKRFFCLPHFALEGEITMTYFTYAATAEAAHEKAETFWNSEIAKARANRSNKGSGATKKGRPQSTLITPELLAKLDDFDPKG